MASKGIYVYGHARKRRLNGSPLKWVSPLGNRGFVRHFRNGRSIRTCPRKAPNWTVCAQACLGEKPLLWNGTRGPNVSFITISQADHTYLKSKLMEFIWRNHHPKLKTRRAINLLTRARLVIMTRSMYKYCQSPRLEEICTKKRETYIKGDFLHVQIYDRKNTLSFL